MSHAVWSYSRFSLSYRDVEELMVERGVTVSYEAVRYWCRTFGQAYANPLRRCRPRPGDPWHLDEVFLTINGKQWQTSLSVVRGGAGGPCPRHSGATPSRDKAAAKTFFRKLLKGC
jgi:putative transposase